MPSVIRINPGRAPEISPCENTLTLAFLQSCVGGYIETVPLSERARKAVPNALMIVNEEGMINALPYNRAASLALRDELSPYETPIFGPAVIGAVEGENIRPLTDDEARRLCAVLCEMAKINEYGGEEECQ